MGDETKKMAKRTTTTLAQVKATAAKLGVEIEVESEPAQYDRWGRWQHHTITAMAPDGHCFKATGDTHTLCVQGHTEGVPAINKDEALGAMLRDLQDGIEEHVDADCEYCHPPDESDEVES